MGLQIMRMPDLSAPDQIILRCAVHLSHRGQPAGGIARVRSRNPEGDVVVLFRKIDATLIQGYVRPYLRMLREIAPATSGVSCQYSKAIAVSRMVPSGREFACRAASSVVSTFVRN